MMHTLRRFFVRHRMTLVGAVVVLALVAAIMAKGTPDGVPFDELEPGMLVEMDGGELGSGTQVKVVKVESEGVHIVLMGESESIDVDGIEISMDRMHVPIGRVLWNDTPSHEVGRETVDKDDLDGYRQWSSEGGDYFG